MVEQGDAESFARWVGKMQQVGDERVLSHFGEKTTFSRS
jgi:hypothetical protein